jgi:glycosyltransferase involved in cell wall biosynthesis
VLWRERPDVVFVMSPPPVAIAAVYCYCRARGGRYVVDAHSGVFFTRRWRHFQAMQYWLCRRAVTTIVTNEYVAGLVRAHGGSATVVPDVPVEFDSPAAPIDAPDGFIVVCVTSFDRDEPVSAMVEAARRLPEVPFLITGDIAFAPRPLRGTLPPNLTPTGFLETSSYGGLLRKAGVVMALTTDDHTMQRGAYEAIYQGTPVIVSDTQVLRQAFDEGAVHVNNTPEAIVAAVVRVRDNAPEYRDAARRLRARKLSRWDRTRAELLAALRARS